ncbi:integral membrane protein duf6 domain containing protein [Acanthamoeba castellanii str. Neff]|uniref:Integral membrane protein duf6 domain containing protein n=1 Tax=Acanthamoeba castellanii (strain ATCC 30010 / Neff) TaxID=1257118 RepID=L8HLD7_ACACF|nr:integral membrane protein duf6 domain containing protein [Acanthamoeba castellanii str. Neff]ELR25196.1 integral membrane protein duf6 domain containing protein [Acanthamoeba castellanii str. Neff]
MLLIPIWTCIVCVILGREEKGWLKFLGIVVTIIGAVVLLEVESFELSHDTMMGNFLVIVTTVLYTIYIVMGKPLCSKIPPFTLSFIMFGASSCMCIIFVWTDWGQWGALWDLPLEAWVSVFIATFVGTFVTYGLTTWALRQAPETTVVLYGPVELIFTGVMAVTILGERLTWRLLAGSSGIVAGLFLVIYALHREAAARQQGHHWLEQESRCDTANSKPACSVVEEGGSAKLEQCDESTALLGTR